jgi:queuine tRNA-ribosyltransferase
LRAAGRDGSPERAAGALNPAPASFSDNQGATFEDQRIRHMQDIARLDLDGSHRRSFRRGINRRGYRIVEVLDPVMPQRKYGI